MESEKTWLETIWDDRPKQLILGLCLLLAVGIIAVYVQTAGFDFVDYDDPFYVPRNPQVLAGLTWDGVKWAFTTMHAGNWIPLVWLSLMLDRSVLGVGAGGFHLVNVAIHIANAILLFWVLKRYSKAIWASFFVAALFALHPLHVESVAWVTERKDVLSTLFWMLTMLAYARYVERRTAGRYITVCVTFALGLMAKSMLVTLPPVLLLMDYWPLKRLWPEEEKNGFAVGRLLFEKLPLVIMSALVCVVTVIAQKSGGAVAKISIVPLGQRIGNALVSYCQYLIKTFWPVDLAVFYPYPASPIAGWKVVASLAVLLAITIAVILLRRHRYLLVGWLWYLGTLVPVIGFVQVGGQALADRYTYIPLTGIFIMLAWLAGDILAQSRHKKLVVGVVGSAILGVLGILAFRQVSCWRDTATLFESCAAVTPDNVVVHRYLGLGFAKKGDNESALREFKATLRFEPTDTRTFYNIGVMLTLLGRIDEAIEYYNRILELKPGDVDTYGNLASLRIVKGEFDRAMELYREGLSRNPGDAGLHKGLGLLFLQTGRVDEAIQELEQVVKLKADASAYCNLGLALTAKGETKRAIDYYTKSIQLAPDSAETHFSLGNAYLAQSNPTGAIMEYQEAILAKPDYAKAYCNMAAVLLRTGRLDEAIINFHRAVELEPNNPDFNFNLASAFAKKELFDEAAEQMRKTVELVPANTGARCELAKLLLRTGKIEEAIAEYENALKIDPANKNAQAGLEKARAIQASNSTPANP